MINFDDVSKENIKQHNPNWPQIPDHTCRILTIGGPKSWKTDALFNLKNQQQDVDKICLYAKDTYEAKYQFLNTKQEYTDLKYFSDSKALIECLTIQSK